MVGCSVFKAHGMDIPYNTLLYYRGTIGLERKKNKQLKDVTPIITHLFANVIQSKAGDSYVYHRTDNGT